MIAFCQFLFLISLVVLLVSGVRHLRQRPLRARGEQVMAEERRRTVPNDGRVSIQYAYLDRSGNEYTKWRHGVSVEPAGPLVGVVYDTQKPARAEFTALLPESPRPKRVFLLCVLVLAVVCFVPGWIVPRL
ncbi:DUF3592 domain-containing protein [Streptomyces sp. NPDC008125]|uniref:DUF3592 domain-containing protein n=1 Tax=Streptomyces sp. NPDC008125 TaxID=3364811 RepID=UPI0036E2F038